MIAAWYERSKSSFFSTDKKLRKMFFINENIRKGLDKRSYLSTGYRYMRNMRKFSLATYSISLISRSQQCPNL